MSNVSFDEGPTYQQAPLAAAKPYLVRLVISWGLAKDDASAKTVLISIAVVAGVLAILVPFLMREKNVPLPAPVVPLPVEQGRTF